MLELWERAHASVTTGLSHQSVPSNYEPRSFQLRDYSLELRIRSFRLRNPSFRLRTRSFRLRARRRRAIEGEIPPHWLIYRRDMASGMMIRGKVMRFAREACRPGR